MIDLSNKGRMKNKRAQMQIPFQFILSMILIAVFIVVTFFVIRNFLELQRCTEIGLFVEELQDEVNDVWRVQEANTAIELGLPSSLEYVCFANLSVGMNLVAVPSDERENLAGIYDGLKSYFRHRNANLFFYPWKSACSMPTHLIEHVNIAGLSNPYCLPNVKGEVKFRLIKGFNDALVKVRR